MKYFHIQILIICISLAGNLLAQKDLADSLTNKLSTSSGKTKVDVLSQLADTYLYINNQTAIQYAEQGIKLADSIDYEKGLAACYGGLGFANINLDNNKAIEFTQKALHIRRELHDKPGIATSLNVLGVIYYYLGEYLKSIEFHTKAISLREEIGDKVRTATSYNNVALVHMALENYDTALEYLFKALKVREDSNNLRGVAIIKTNIGNIYANQGLNEKAFEYLFDALKINKQIGTKISEANSYFSIANLYKQINQSGKAFNYYEKAIYLYNKLDEKNGIANTENGLAELFLKEVEIDSATRHAENALQYAREIHSLDNIVKSTDILQTCYRSKGDYKSAFAYLSEYKIAKDSLKSDSKLKKLAKIELDNKLQKMTKEQENQLKRQNLYIQFLVLVLIFVAVIFVLVLRGLRTRRQTNKQLNQLNRRLKEVNSTKDKFFSIIAHDLRGPYQTFLGLTNFLLENQESISKEELTEALTSMNSSLHKQFNLLNELLQWSELQSGRFELTLETFSLKDCVDEVADALTLTAVQKKISIKNRIDSSTEVTADMNMLRLVIRNLISNSIKFTRENGNVIIDAESNPDSVEVSVSDTGIGMEKSVLNNLFRLDVHNTHSGTANEKGTGLGLILCKEIIEKHGGIIYAESESEKGSKFFFTLPVKK